MNNEKGRAAGRLVLEGGPARQEVLPTRLEQRAHPAAAAFDHPGDEHLQLRVHQSPVRIDEGEAGRRRRRAGQQRDQRARGEVPASSKRGRLTTPRPASAQSISTSPSSASKGRGRSASAVPRAWRRSRSILAAGETQQEAVVARASRSRASRARPAGRDSRAKRRAPGGSRGCAAPACSNPRACRGPRRRRPPRPAVDRAVRQAQPDLDLGEPAWKPGIAGATIRRPSPSGAVILIAPRGARRDRRDRGLGFGHRLEHLGALVEARPTRSG